jgi:hypothetical protein
MAHPSDKVLSEAKGKRDALEPLPTEDDLGRMIRWGLEDSFSGKEPPDDVWPKIMLRVQEMRGSARRTPVKRRPSFSLAPLVQTVVVSALLLAFGLGVDRNLTVPRGEHAVRATPTVQRVDSSQELPNDMLSGYLLARMEQQLAAHQRPGGARP